MYVQDARSHVCSSRLGVAPPSQSSTNVYRSCPVRFK